MNERRLLASAGLFLAFLALGFWQMRNYTDPVTLAFLLGCCGVVAAVGFYTFAAGHR